MKEPATVDIRFYTRKECHLCHAALDEVRRALAPFDGVARLRVLDIDTDPAARALYDTRVPVCFVGARHLFDYRCDGEALRSAVREALEAVAGQAAARAAARKPLVAVDVRTLRPPASGVGRYTASMLRALAALEDGPALLAVADGASAPAASDFPATVDWVTTKADLESHPLGDWRFHVDVPRALRRRDRPPEVFWGPAFQLPARSIGCPRIVTIHDLAAFLHPTTMPRKFALYLRWAVRGAVARADVVVAVSEATKRGLIEELRVPERRIVVIGEGPLLAAAHGELPGELPREVEGRPFLLFVGALEPRKNVEFLVRVFERLRAAGDERLLVLCGPPGWRNAAALRALERTPAREAIRRLQFVDEATLAALYGRADAVLMPSLYEGFGLPALEAAALGTPAFVSDRGALPEVALDERFVLPLDEEVWCEALLEPAGVEPDELRRHAARFSWSDAAARLAALFREMSVR